MGRDLMGASFANPKGHGEEAEIVAIHNHFLQVNGTDWRYDGSFPLLMPDNSLENLRDYVQRRKSKCSVQALGYGAKDPRAALFLDHWFEACEGNIRFVLVYRNWKFAVSSLMKRHSRTLLQFNQSMQDRTEDIDFWQRPDLAATMWLLSTERMLSCVKNYPKCTLLFEQSAFVADNELVCSAAQSKGIPQQALRSHAYDATLLQKDIPESLFAMVSPELQKRCDEAMRQLHAFADVSKVSSVSKRQSHPLTAPIIDEFNRQSSKRAEIESKNTSLSPRPKITLAGMSIGDAISTMKTMNRSLLAFVDWHYWIAKPCSANEAIELFYLATKGKANVAAEIFIGRAAVKRDLYWQWIHFGDHFFQMQHFDNAQRCYQRAADTQPEHPGVIARLADIATKAGEFDRADTLITKASCIEPTHPAIESAKVRLKRALKSCSPASSVRQGDATFSSISDYQQVVTAMAEDSRWGNAVDRYMVQSNFILRDNLTWLYEGSSQLSSNAKRCLFDYIFQHLDAYWSRETLITTFAKGAKYNHWADSYDWQVSPRSLSSASTKLGVHIHVFYVDLLPEILGFLLPLPTSSQIIITTTANNHNAVCEITSKLKHCDVIVVDNRGRDIGPWLMVAGPKLSGCDIVLKLHTKATPHSRRLSGWRLQLLWSLVGGYPTKIDSILATFMADSTLGLYLPPYHPEIIEDLDWGDNFDMAAALASSMGLELTSDVGDFPAGSMFWYRPDALKPLFEREWKPSDFPQELGQIDGTLMHVIERLLCNIAKHKGYNYRFIDVFPAKEVS
ncbi:hypothetical protein KIU71_01325 [Alteromonas sp. SM 2104]|nr:hypothetical protein [Alteromonas oceanisediminis]